MIPVTRPYLPDINKLHLYIDRIYEKRWLTNDGELLKELTDRLRQYLGVNNLLLVANGTLALQIAYAALSIKDSALTTPFSFIATVSSLDWQGVAFRFVDIDAETFCIDPNLVEESIKSDTCAIVPVHVYGNTCDIEKIDDIARKNNIKVVYDASHSFGVKYCGRNVLNYGDASTISFHATKLFHTIEGGAIVFKDDAHYEIAKKLINFGEIFVNGIKKIGINAKMNEFQAAMGLSVLEGIDLIMERRTEIWEYYENKLRRYFRLQKRNPLASNNHAYFPVVFEDEDKLLTAEYTLKERGIFPRRYFYPSLDVICETDQYMPVSRNIAERVLCIPIYAGLTDADVELVCETLIVAVR